jgi:S-adenosylmethionine:tRNA ribosyltransferase-isomerase
MIAAHAPVQRPVDGKLLRVDGRGRLRHATRRRFVDLLQAGDLVVGNDAATLPASLQGRHVPTNGAIEVRLAGWPARGTDDVSHFLAIVFGPGDFHTRTENRPAPPSMAPGDRLMLGPLAATVTALLDHPRFVSLRFDGTQDEIWAGLARHGRPIQYAHIATPLALWDVWTRFAGRPVAFEPPSAGFVLDWRALGAMHARGIAFATITHAAGISSTGDDALDRRLPFDEPYHIPEATARAIGGARARGARVVAIGTTVVRALEHAARTDGEVRAGAGVATQTIDGTSRLRIVDVVLTGLHEPGTSHYRLLRAFLDEATLRRVDEELRRYDYRSHEFGDSVLIERNTRGAAFVRPRSRSRTDSTLSRSV